MGENCSMSTVTCGMAWANLATHYHWKWRSCSLDQLWCSSHPSVSQFNYLMLAGNWPSRKIWVVFCWTNRLNLITKGFDKYWADTLEEMGCLVSGGFKEKEGQEIGNRAGGGCCSGSRTGWDVHMKYVLHEAVTFSHHKALLCFQHAVEQL